jgi:prophage regulatory protein
MNKTFKPGDRLLSWKQLKDIIPVSRTQVYRLMAAGKFPKAIQVSENRVAWLESEICAWLSERMNSN